MWKIFENVSVACLAGCLLTTVAGCNDGTEPPAAGSGQRQSSDNTQPTETIEPTATPTTTPTEVTLQSVDLAGYQGELEKHQGKVVFVDFWATWCGNCRKAFPHTVTWSKELPAADFAVISVSVDEPTEDYKKEALDFLNAQQATFTNLIASYEDPDESFELFNIPDGALPHYKLYGRDGKLIRTFGIDSKEKWGPKDVEAAIKAAIENK